MATELDEIADEQSSKLTDDGVELAEQSGFDATGLSERAVGPGWMAVRDAANQHACAAIVVGSRGLTGISAALGGVSNGVVHNSRRPVLVVPARGDRMSRVLVAYASKHGATAEIAEAVAAELRQAGHEVDCMSAEQVSGLDAYDAAVIGSAVYMKRWLPEARRLLKRHAKELADRPFWVFSSRPFGEKPDPAWSEPPRTIKRAGTPGRP